MAINKWLRYATQSMRLPKLSLLTGISEGKLLSYKRGLKVLPTTYGKKIRRAYNFRIGEVLNKAGVPSWDIGRHRDKAYNTIKGISKTYDDISHFIANQKGISVRSVKGGMRMTEKPYEYYKHLEEEYIV